MPCTQAYIEMCRGRRGDRRCKKCRWFGHIACYCRKEIMEERRKKLLCEVNRLVPLESRVCRRMEAGNVVHPFKGEVQPTKYWGYGEARHVLWGCPKRAAWSSIRT